MSECPADMSGDVRDKLSGSYGPHQHAYAGAIGQRPGTGEDALDEQIAAQLAVAVTPHLRQL